MYIYIYSMILLTWHVIYIQTYDIWVGVRMVDSIKQMANFLCAKMMVKH